MQSREPRVVGEEEARLRRLWSEHRVRPLPRQQDERMAEISLYDSWLSGIVDAALERGGRLSPEHQLMLEVRRREGNQEIWRLAGELGEPLRSHVARLFELEDLVTRLPRD